VENINIGHMGCYFDNEKITTKANFELFTFQTSEAAACYRTGVNQNTDHGT
jgi:hypothetical protein